jgi:hypothetical protein
LALAAPATPASHHRSARSLLSAGGSFFVPLRCEKQKTPTGQTGSKTMEYQSNINHNSNSAAVLASNGLTSSIASNPASSNENRKPVSAQQLVRENVQFLIQQLEAGKSEALTAYLDAMVHFHNYSFGNVLAIARQRAVT